MSKTNLACNPFVFRQTPDSRYSHYESAGADPWSELVDVVARCMQRSELVTKKNADGTVLGVTVPLDMAPGRFFSGVVRVTSETVLSAFFATRPGAPDGERPYVQFTAVNGTKAAAAAVEVVLYACELLPLKERTYTPEGTDCPVVVDAQWQIISVNVRDTVEPEPPTPMAMARNMALHMGLPEGAGGTARVYTAEEFVRAILHWSDRTMSGGR